MKTVIKFTGTLRPPAKEAYRGSVTVFGDTDLHGKMKTQAFSDLESIGSAAVLEGKTRSERIICDVVVEGVQLSGKGAVISFLVKKVTRSPIATPAFNSKQPVKYRYGLANAVFAGWDVTHKRSGAWSRDHLVLSFRDFSCVLRQMEDYKERLKVLQEAKGAGVTAVLEMTPLKDSTVQEADEFCDAFCELFAFATKNSVHWVTRADCLTGSSYFRGVGRLSPVTSGFRLIPDAVSEPGNRLRPELKRFLESTLDVYLDKYRPDLRLALAWKEDADQQHNVDLQFLACYVALETLRSKLLRSKSKPTIPDWHNHLKTGLEDEICALIEKRTGIPSASYKGELGGLLKRLGAPSLSKQLDTLCDQFGVRRVSREMARLRNALFHAGELGDFKAGLEQTQQLSHLFDVMILRILGFKGVYHHIDTKWKQVVLD